MFFGVGFFEVLPGSWSLGFWTGSWRALAQELGGFRRLGVPYFGVPITRILLFRVPLFSDTPIWPLYTVTNGNGTYGPYTP